LNNFYSIDIQVLRTIIYIEFTLIKKERAICVKFCNAPDREPVRSVVKVHRYHVTTVKVQVGREISNSSTAPIVAVNTRVVQLAITVVPVPCGRQEKSKK